MIDTPLSRRCVVIIDDDFRLCETLKDALDDASTEVFHAQTGAAGLALLRNRTVDVVLLDQNLPDTSGAALCPALLDGRDGTKVIFMTAFPTFANAVAALKVGAADYLSKPFELEELRLAVRNALRVQELERIEQLHARRQRQENETSVFIGFAPALSSCLRLAGVAAQSDSAVLITGETGTGKSLLARHIHYASRRREHPFVSLNCAALPEHLAESELYGHEKGSFTGALSSRRGIFEMAESGTVFLDEIGAMPYHLQAKLLGVLEERLVRRIGGEATRRVTARIIAATNTDLETAVAGKAFRQDLYYRLGVMHLHLPPLRNRLEDLPALVAHLIRAIAGRDVPLANGEIALLSRYPWPGNVRELSNVLERSLLLHAPGPLQPSELLTAAGKEREPEAREPHAPLTDGDALLTLEDVERKHIATVLTRFGGNLTRSAEALGIGLSTLKRKVAEGGLRSPRP